MERSLISLKEQSETVKANKRWRDPVHTLRIQVNKFDEFYWNLLKFDGFGPHRISKSTILLLNGFKIFEKIKKYVKKLE
jgi:hypothetical protein